MRIVITGATGNVGTALLDRLGRDDHELVGVVRRPPQDPSLAGRVTWHAADLARPESIEPLTAACRGADAVVHLAWGFQPSHRLDLLEALGVGGTRRVLEAVAATGVPHLVHMSSVGAYSPRSGLSPVDESYPTHGVPTSPYSRHKAAAERLLDDFATERPDVRVTRMRPGIIGQRDAGSALLRYGVPGLVPAAALRHVPVLPCDTSLRIPVVHADDVAQAIAVALQGRISGAFNLAAEPVVTAQDVADVLGARLLPVPARLLRAGVSAAWHARVLQLDPGWIDLGFAVPLLDTSRARAELGWAPTMTGIEVLEEMVSGMATAAHGRTPALRARRVGEQLVTALRDGPVSHRRRP